MNLEHLWGDAKQLAIHFSICEPMHFGMSRPQSASALINGHNNKSNSSATRIAIIDVLCVKLSVHTLLFVELLPPALSKSVGSDTNDKIFLQLCTPEVI